MIESCDKALLPYDSLAKLGVDIVADEVAEMINALSIALQNKMRIDEIITTEFASHPKLTASPLANPVVVVALDAFTRLTTVRYFTYLQHGHV